MKYIINNDKVVGIYRDTDDIRTASNGMEVVLGPPLYNSKRQHRGYGMTRAELLSELGLTDENVRKQQVKRMEDDVRAQQEFLGVDAVFLVLCHQFKGVSSRAESVVNWTDSFWITHYHSKKADVLSGAAEVNLDFSEVEEPPYGFSQVREEVDSL